MVPPEKPETGPLVIIITGLPCTGKTILARQVAAEFSLPLISKDDIKEILFDQLGWADREWSKKLGRATYAILFHQLEALLAAGRSAVVESNFQAEFQTPLFTALQHKYSFVPFQIQLVAQGEVLFERFKRRSESGERHPGHVDAQNYAEFQAALLRGRLEPLEVGGTYLELDTTHFSQVDVSALIRTIHAFDAIIS